jgi:clathrin heavy chain
METCSMESENFITTCEPGQLTIVDLTSGNAVTKQRMSAEAAIMNPVSKVIALRGNSLSCLEATLTILSWPTITNL